MENESQAEFVVKRMPTCPESHRASIDEFLTHIRDKIERSLNDHRVLAMTDKSPRTVGMVKHLRNQLGTLNHLIYLNHIRRKERRGTAD